LKEMDSVFKMMYKKDGEYKAYERASGGNSNDIKKFILIVL